MLTDDQLMADRYLGVLDPKLDVHFFHHRSVYVLVYKLIYESSL
jgi:hypothetical protein